MNPLLSNLQPYPFERLRLLFAGITPNPDYRPISLGIGEPQHATPAFIKDALDAAVRSSPSGLAAYPATAGSVKLREAFAAWLLRRYKLALDPATQMLPVNGSREALFALAQTIVDPTRVASADDRPPPGRPKAGDAPPGGSEAHEVASVGAPLVVCPNPFYQIYEGAAILSGARPWFVPAVASRNFAQDWDSVPESVWANTQLLFVCSPGNPTGAVMPLEEWKKLFDLSDRHGFVIASDECYSEIYFRDEPPLGGLEAAARLGRKDFKNLISFTSLSKRSNVPGMRSGFVAGDAAIIKQFLLYRTYHGSAMSPVVQSASAAAWADEAHVVANRDMYRQKFAQVTPVLASVMDVALPDAGFYLWAGVPAKKGLAAAPHDDVEFARELFALYNVTVLPGSYLARNGNAGSEGVSGRGQGQADLPVDGQNPGAGRFRMALVAETAECLEAAQRIVQFVKSRS
jgi:N-succinyldiaminopimelate aminotransferase